MNLIELIFKLIDQFVPISSVKIKQLEDQGMEWYDKLDENDSKNAIVTFLKEKGELWYVKVIFALSYIFLIRYIQDFMNPREDYEDEFERPGHMRRAS